MTDLRTIERESIRAFIQSAADEGYLSGRVLDYGAGKQPWREVVEAAGGEYLPYDRAEFPANVSGQDVGFIGTANWMWDFDTILCTQVVQYVPDVEEWSISLWQALSEHGHLVLTYPTNWPETEPEDLHRFTKAGMERLLIETGFTIVRHEPRYFARLATEDHPRKLLSTEWLALGYGVICRA